MNKVKNVKPETAICQLKKNAISERTEPIKIVTANQVFIVKMSTEKPNSCRNCFTFCLRFERGKMSSNFVCGSIFLSLKVCVKPIAFRIL